MILYFNATAPTEIYFRSLHDALPICEHIRDVRGANNARRGRVLHINHPAVGRAIAGRIHRRVDDGVYGQDRKSTRLNSSHLGISYAVFCLKKKKIYGKSKRLETCTIF